MKKAKATLLAALLVIAGISLVNAAAPAPVPVAASTPADDITLNLKNIPLPVIDSLRQAVVNSGAFAFPAGLEPRPVQFLMLRVTGSTASGTIVLGPAPVK